jgi:hypothetical protein
MFCGGFVAVLWQRVFPCLGCGSTCGVLTDVRGTLSDGSGPSNHENSATCLWIIAPANATQITITFTAFSTELYVDAVQVYECVNVSCHSVKLLGELSGTYDTDQSISSSTGYMLVQFRSDSAVSQAGFEARWNSMVNSAYAPLSLPVVSQFFCIVVVAL